MLNLDSLSVVLTHHHIFLWQEPIILYKENVIQENSKDAAAAASSCCGSGIVQGHCCWQFMSFRKIPKTLLLAAHEFQENS